jgi:hypothetical protein
MTEKIKSFLTENPQSFGIFFVLVGIIILLAAITDANWLFGDVNTTTYNMGKIDGWVNFFGRKTARIIAGVSSIAVILGGIFWFWAYGYYFKKD